MVALRLSEAAIDLHVKTGTNHHATAQTHELFRSLHNKVRTDLNNMKKEKKKTSSTPYVSASLRELETQEEWTNCSQLRELHSWDSWLFKKQIRAVFICPTRNPISVFLLQEDDD